MAKAGLAHPARRPDIDGLRAVAVLSVVAYHAWPAAVPWGFIGVDIFFVISGYLITTILLENLASGRFAFAEFYERRVRRIFPALAVVLAATYAAGLFLLLPSEMATLGTHVAAGGGFVANLLLWSESGYFDAAAASKPLLHLWSLGVEEQFYIAWPLVLWLLRRRPRALAAACFAFPLASFAWGCLEIHGDRVGAFYSPLARIWEILAGGSLAWIVANRPAWLEGRGGLASTGALVCFVVAAGCIDEGRVFPGAWALAPVACAWLCIAAGPAAWLNARVLAHPAMVAVGLVSYPLYLWHWPLLTYARLAQEGAASAESRVAAIAAAFVLAWATWRFVEAPLRFGARGRMKAWLLAAVMAAVVAAGLVAREQAGYPVRLPPLVAGLVDFKFDLPAAARASTCFLDPEQDRGAFDRCPDRYASPALLLWGDSHAAHLYPGIAARFGERYHVVQRTASACPPLAGIEVESRPHCRGINDRVIAEVEASPPEAVVLSARWGYAGYRDGGALDRTITRLKAAGVRRIVLVGPSPIWKEPVPRLLYSRYRADPLHRVPERVVDGIEPAAASVEAAIEGIARARGVDYLSATRALCDDHGCLARVGEGRDGVMFGDNNHFTPAGSRFLAAKLPIPDGPAAIR